MDAFDKWALEYAPSNRADCEAAFRAGMRAAAALEAELTRGYYDHAKGPYIRYRDAILSEADK